MKFTRERVKFTRERVKYTRERVKFTRERVKYTRERVKYTRERGKYTRERVKYTREKGAGLKPCATEGCYCAKKKLEPHAPYPAQHCCAAFFMFLALYKVFRVRQISAFLLLVFQKLDNWR